MVPDAVTCMVYSLYAWRLSNDCIRVGGTSYTCAMMKMLIFADSYARGDCGARLPLLRARCDTYNRDEFELPAKTSYTGCEIWVIGRSRVGRLCPLVP